MSVAFKPDRYGIVVITKWTSNSGRWIIFLGIHYDDTHYCWDVGQFQTTTGAVQRLHFKDNKTGATIEYDALKERLGRIKPSTAERDRFHFFGPRDVS